MFHIILLLLPFIFLILLCIIAILIIAYFVITVILLIIGHVKSRSKLFIGASIALMFGIFVALFGGSYLVCNLMYPTQYPYKDIEILSMTYEEIVSEYGTPDVVSDDVIKYKISSSSYYDIYYEIIFRDGTASDIERKIYEKSE